MMTSPTPRGHHNQQTSPRPSSEHGRNPRESVVQHYHVNNSRISSGSTNRTTSPTRAGDAIPIPGVERRSSFAERIGSFGDAGGVNSLNNFARSWQRAASFREIASPARRPFLYQYEDHESEDEGDRFRNDPERGRTRRSTANDLLKAAIAHDHRDHNLQIHDSPFLEDEEDDETSALLGPQSTNGRRRSTRRSIAHDGTIFRIKPQLASPFGGVRNVHDGYGSVTPRISDAATSKSYGTQIFPAEDSYHGMYKENDLHIIKRVESHNGEVVNRVCGRSTVPQTIFNSANVLIGVGMLSLPLAVKYSGWVIAIIAFVFASVSTSYTSKLLAKCLDEDPSLVTFGDLAYVSFGRTARIATSLIFTIELIGACVALVVLFADSLNALVPGWSIIQWKILCGIILLPLCLLPLRFLSVTSILGIMTCVGIALGIVADGLIKSHAPGSLRDPAVTYLFPQDWRALPLAFGLFMAPWGGQSVFPNIYRDMRHPAKYNKAVNITYIFTFILEGAIAVAGFLMFGDKVLNEITSNLVVTSGYPRWINIAIVIAIAIIPLTKVPLSGRPIVSTIEVFCNLNKQANANTQLSDDETGSEGAYRDESSKMLSPFWRSMLRLLINISCTVLFVVIAILVPSFDRIMGLLGSFACFTVCIVLPCAFHLKLFAGRLSLAQRILDWTLLVLSVILAILGTVCAFLPKSWMGLEG